jgi:hypothetical protein
MLTEVAEEAYAAWSKGQDAAPFWRIVDPERPSAKRLAGGADFIRARRQAELAGRNTP